MGNNSMGVRTNILGFPRIGRQRELKRACEAFWGGKISSDELLSVGKALRRETWQGLQKAGVDLIPSGDFSLYDQVLDLSLTLGAIPHRYEKLKGDKVDLYFAMAHGAQKDGEDVIAMEMTKWFDTNYHYIVPEFLREQSFELFDTKYVDEFLEAKAIGIHTKPVLVGPVTYLLLGKEKEEGFARIDLLDKLLPVYVQLLNKLEEAGADYVQIDEPYLALDIDEKTVAAYRKAFDYISLHSGLKVIITTYFDGLKDNTNLAVSLPSYALHVDLVRAPEQLNDVLESLPAGKVLSLGVVDGRNVWKNDYEASLSLVNRAVEQIGKERVMVAGSSSFLHVPCDLKLETKENSALASIRRWLSFAWQKVEEIATLKELIQENPSVEAKKALEANKADMEARRASAIIHDPAVKARVGNVTPEYSRRKSPFAVRYKIQQEKLQLPLFPTTTIGSFPQTKEVRAWRSKFKKGEISAEEYDSLLKAETERCIRKQEEMGLDVLVHGEFERNDMVEYFGEQLAGFAFSQYGWVQSYGSRCVKPPIIFGDVSRPHAMTVEWSVFAQSLTSRLMKGMLTGPVTILDWSFVRDDQPRSETCLQIALAIRDEVCDLEKAGLKVIQIDEPAIREGLPLRRKDWDEYLKWAVDCFCVSASGVRDDTQIHTHMCYSEFNDIIEHIAKMDADVITIECSRSQMELLDVFRVFKYPNGIGPGVYDIHSARVPEKEEILGLLRKAAKLIDPHLLWVNPDCGLKTRGWEETEKCLVKMVEAAKDIRAEY